MPVSRHTFTGVDTDTDAGSKPESKFDAALNVSLELGALAPVTGNVATSFYALPAQGTTQSLGSIEDGATGTAVEFLYNSAGFHRLVRYDPAGSAGVGARTTLLEWAGLGLSADLVLQGGVLDGLLWYLGADGMFRCLNLARAASGYYTPALLAAEPFCLHLVKVPPTSTRPSAQRVTASTGAAGESLHLVQRKAYQFACRWSYLDGEQTVLSPYSEWLDIVEDPATTTLNAILVTLPPAPAGVTEVEVLVREPDTAGWLVADTLRRNAQGVLATSYTFYGVVSGAAVTNAEAGRLFEAEWPGGAAENARGRLFKSNLLEGYPTPEPAFVVDVVSGPTSTVATQDVYQFSYQQADGNGGSATATLSYVLASGAALAPGSAYYLAYAITGTPGAWQAVATTAISYQQAFVDPQFNEVTPIDPASRTTTTLSAQTVTTQYVGVQTLHERASYRVVMQFYDAQGRPYGCSQPRTVYVPAQTDPPQVRNLRVTLTTIGQAALNAEIPEGAYSYSFLVAPNDRALEFRQGQAADTRAFLGVTRLELTDGTVREKLNTPDRRVGHQKLVVDIGNWPPVGLGYVYQPGDIMRFLDENVEFPLVGQRGDYLELNWSGFPVADRPRIEIYTPVSQAGQTYYERGPRMAITRTGNNRSYSQPGVVLEGDCYLANLRFPILVFDGNYSPPDKKQYTAGQEGQVTVESMVPTFRLVPAYTPTRTLTNVDANVSDQAINDLLNGGGGPNSGATTSNVADTATRDATSLLWLDMSKGGRPGVQLPLRLQQVRRDVVRFSGQKQVGNLVNGLSRWEALNQYDKLPAEQGQVTALVLADQSQTDGSVLLAVQQHGIESLYLNQQPIKTGADSILIAQNDQVVAADNTLKGGFGCVDPGTIAPYAGMVFYYCRERAEVMRYHNGLTPLALTYKFRAKLQQLTRQYAGAAVKGFFDPRRQEYWLVFYPLGTRPGATLIWSERYQQWADELSCRPEAGAYVGNELVTWLAGTLWRHTANGAPGYFFNVFTQPWVQFTAATPDDATKRWQGVAQRTEGGLWLLTRVTTDTGQASRTRPEWWQKREGIWRLANGLRRDELTPGFAGIYQAVDQGKPLVSPRATFTFTCPDNDARALTAVEVGWQLRAGQGLGAPG